MKRLLAAIALAIAPVAVAAQGYEGDAGSGLRLGIQELNNSGQVGAVTMYRRGMAKTQLDVNLDGAPARAESLRIYRGKSCDDVSHEPEAIVLNDLKGGRSTTTVNWPQAKLLSGNYNMLVFSSTAAGARTVACGHLAP